MYDSVIIKTRCLHILAFKFKCMHILLSSVIVITVITCINIFRNLILQRYRQLYASNTLTYDTGERLNIDNTDGPLQAHIYWRSSK